MLHYMNVVAAVAAVALQVYIVSAPAVGFHALHIFICILFILLLLLLLAKPGQCSHFKFEAAGGPRPSAHSSRSPLLRRRRYQDGPPRFPSPPSSPSRRRQQRLRPVQREAEEPPRRRFQNQPRPGLRPHKRKKRSLEERSEERRKKGSKDQGDKDDTEKQKRHKKHRPFPTTFQRNEYRKIPPLILADTCSRSDGRCLGEIISKPALDERPLNPSLSTVPTVEPA